MIADCLYTLGAESSKKRAYVLSYLEDADSCGIRVRNYLGSGVSLLFNRECAVCLIVYLFNPFPVIGSAAAGIIIRLVWVETAGLSKKDKYSKCDQMASLQKETATDGSEAGINPLAISLWKAQHLCL